MKNEVAGGDRQVFLVEGEDFRLETWPLSEEQSSAVMVHKTRQAFGELDHHLFPAVSRELGPHGNLDHLSENKINNPLPVFMGHAANESCSPSGEPWNRTLRQSAPPGHVDGNSSMEPPVTITPGPTMSGLGKGSRR